MKNLQDMGLNSFFENSFKKSEFRDRSIGRVTAVHKNIYVVTCEDCEVHAKVSGKFMHKVPSRSAFPVTGDWVTIDIQKESDFSVISSVLDRINHISRNVAGGRSRTSGGLTNEQVIASNIDTIFIVSGLDRDFNLRRIERYLTLVYNSGASPVIILNKADICPDPDSFIAEVESVAFGVPVYAVSAEKGEGTDSLKSHLTYGSTTALLGSSGVGKSTIINCLMGYQKQKVHEISEAVGKGMHTTTHRELIVLPDGGLIIDNPGMRELQLWDGEENVGVVFQDIEELAEGCRFSDCTHETEPDCSVRNAIHEGILDEKRFLSYQKLKRELHYIEERKEKSADHIEKEKWKDIRIFQKELYKKIKHK